jgi:hemerythrin-like metal-binding protein
MNSFTWTDEYSVGVKKFDLQHQQLFFYISELNDAMVSQLDHKMIADILKGLIQYTKSHFAEEEEQLAGRPTPSLSSIKCSIASSRAGR